MSQKSKSIKEMVETLLIGIQRERAAYQFYLKAAEKSPTNDSKSMLVFLAEQEKSHELKLQAILNEFKAELELEKIKASVG